MEVILKKNVDNLGFKDDVVTVKDGYGRNFLIPQGYAIVATSSAKKAHEEVLRQRSHKENKVKEEAASIASKLEGLTLKVTTKAGESGKIFGSVTTIAVSEALQAEGIQVDRKSIKIENEPVKELGSYKATAILHKEVSQDFEFEVVAE
ncbi:MAG: 50S ribosomal protein L9 [Crocinitomicaceae bacterium]|nr:50S ribosomal protein L9 [Crocinitomicaceae bacterium]